ncbi:acetylornithine deacetylase [Pseudosulfitobacter pseudonitzschiae]|uniref:acetylornithine deacetylase n=1 Tax=Pseudosulfitobacter pseudonitzschiae TaxID=1402135 RepID=UPI001AF106BA|nr:acetylornithine deacetylase [Pseudosulfitobacter pseudonitzschiae]MBM1815464.1 acetylornithine deacetylase [Pseudosulfitobacter pseudonitzschiae]MBM1832455.1 acetylornithine deacetylase [Pseudosulfitobacter pseudonitzschiae]MBM1837323.1 acetylornithine deacetylase [Pseudosulfitobacter pseudonitzschiae]MBM1842169.1 acetylornithine deacetylase [Pseudosulfitobacter pseudonitzschiae]MBM1847037.1 acetylornithine deacetylase [Pseudosulfitobacter pseudonitzschiae]
MPERLTPLQLMTKLISFPTVSRDTNLPLIDWVEDYLGSHGITAHRWPDPDQPHKAALFAHVGPWEEGAVVLSGHTDVVPVDGQPWDSDPWTVTEQDGKYYGRGTCDMKGFDALAIWALVEAHYADVKRPLQLALSFDEEVGCTGAPPMIEAMQPVLPKGELVIVGEPSMLQAVTGHKGGQGFDTHVIGFEVHSSLLHTGVSAILEGAKIIDFANQRNAENFANPPTALGAMFEPPVTTWHVGQISGGTAHNITAKDCWFSMDFRAVPGDDPVALKESYLEHVRTIEARMQTVHPDARVDVKERFAVPPLKPEENGAAEMMVRQITGDNGGHVVSYGTEAGQFQAAGYSAVVCGPGDIAQAHQPNEFITVAQFDLGHQFMRNLVARLG